MSTQIMEQRVHHPYSPSTLQSLEACPCYVGKQSETPHERTTAGTIAHGVAESGMDDSRLDDEDAAAAAECLDFVEQRRQIFEEARQRAVTQLEENTRADRALAQGLILKVLEIKESYLPIDNLHFAEVWVSPFDGTKRAVSFDGTTAGYIDHGFVSWDRKYAEVYDWKFGFWPVEDAANNLQGLSYTLGMFRKYPSLEKVQFFFKQPHLGHVSNVTLHRSDIPVIYRRICVVVERARLARQSGKFDAANPMAPACGFCANIGVCPKVAVIALKVGRKFYPIEVPENITPTSIIEGKDATDCLRVAQVVAVWSKAIKTQITNRVVAGVCQPPPGTVLQTRQDREIVDRKKFEAIVLENLTEQQYRDTCTPGFGKIEAIIKDKAPRGQKTAQVEQFGQALEAVGAVKKGDPYVFLRSIPTKEDK